MEDLGLKQRHSSPADWIFPGWLRRLTGLDPVYMFAKVSHSVIMTTLFFEELARRERDGFPEAYAAARSAEGIRSQRGGEHMVSFLHVYPGLVKTREFETGDFPAVLKFFFTRIMLPLITPLTVQVEKVGEGVLVMAEDERFVLAPSIDVAQADLAELGSNRVRGSGSYCVSWNGRRTIKDNVLESLRKKGARELVWDHVMGGVWWPCCCSQGRIILTAAGDSDRLCCSVCF